MSDYPRRTNGSAHHGSHRRENKICKDRLYNGPGRLGWIGDPPSASCGGRWKLSSSQEARPGRRRRVGLPHLRQPSSPSYIARGTHVTVVDADTYAVVGEIPGTDGVHGIALAPEFGRGFTSNGNSNTVTIFDLKTLKILGTAPTGDGPDAIIVRRSFQACVCLQPSRR